MALQYSRKDALQVWQYSNFEIKKEIQPSIAWHLNTDLQGKLTPLSSNQEIFEYYEPAQSQKGTPTCGDSNMITFGDFPKDEDISRKKVEKLFEMPEVSQEQTPEYSECQDEHPRQGKLGNFFNEMTLMQNLGQKIEKNLINQINDKIEEEEQKKENMVSSSKRNQDPAHGTFLRLSKIRKNSMKSMGGSLGVQTGATSPLSSVMEFELSMNDFKEKSRAEEQHYLSIEQCSFTEHFDLQNVINGKCKQIICYKMRDRRFVMKKITKDILGLQKFYDEYFGNIKEQKPKLNEDQVSCQLFDPWINLKAQYPFQNFVNCYGIIESGDNFYLLTDFLEEFQSSIPQKCEFEQQINSVFEYKKDPFEKLALMVNTYPSPPSPDSSPDTEQVSSLFVQKFRLLMKDPDGLKDMLESRQLQIKKINDSVNKNESNGSQSSSDHFQEEREELSKPTYYGMRRTRSNIVGARHVFDIIKWLDLGSLSALPNIPNCYARNVTSYIMQVSQTLAHAHKNGCVHGKFNLSKVLVQSKEPIKKHIYQFQYHVIDFQPFRVIKILQENWKPNGKITYEHVLESVKVRDLIEFGSSIVDYLCGKSQKDAMTPNKLLKTLTRQQTYMTKPKLETRENSTMGLDSDEKEFKFMRGIPIDLIPLNWCKLPMAQYIFQILMLCFGPHNNQSIEKVDTIKILDQIHSIASEIYVQNFDKNDEIAQRYAVKHPEITEAQKRRFMSAIYNNRAVTCQLNIKSNSNLFEISQMTKKTISYLDEALRQCPLNQVAILNKTLIQWKTGEIRDDEFQSIIQSDLWRVDRDATKLVYVLFKKYIQGYQVLDYEIKELVKQCDQKQKIISNLTRHLLDHPDFMRYRRKTGEHSIKVCKQILTYVETTFNNHTKAICNHRIEMKGEFMAKYMIFSTNDEYLAIISLKNVTIIDCRTGKKVFLLGLPTKEKIVQSPIDTITNKTGDEESISKSEVNFKDKVEEYTVENYMNILGDDVIRQVSMKREIMNQYNAEEELAHLEKSYPPDWIAELGNNGKQLVLFDKAQQQRNLKATFTSNKVEKIFVYSFVHCKTSNFIQPNAKELDMIKLLDGEEVLTFGLDDYVNDHHSLITVQAKDLFMYIIDFELNHVLTKIRQPFGIHLKSIFYDIQKQDQNRKYFQDLKEFIEQNIALGNEVRLPKKNEDIIAIRQKDGNLIQLYNIKQKQVIRKFNLELGEQQFLVPHQHEHDHQEHHNSSCHDDQDLDTQINPSDTLAKAFQEQENKFQQKLIEERKRQKIVKTQGKVHKFEISPNGLLIAAQIGNEIFIRVLNQTCRSQWGNTLEYQNSINFMPIYQDQDYNYIENLKKNVRYQIQQNFKTITGKVISPAKKPKLTPQQITEAIKIYQSLLKFTGTIFTKSKKICDLYETLEIINQDPLALMNSRSKLSKKIYTYEIIRNFNRIDETSVIIEGFNAVRPFILFDRFNFERTFEYIKEFEISGSPKKTMVAVLVNRTVQLYDYMQNKLLFQYDLPNAKETRIGQMSKNLVFLDNDNILIVQETQNRLFIIDVQLAIEQAHRSKQGKKDQDDIIKLPGPKPLGDEIDMGFGRLKIYQDQDSLEEKSQTDSDFHNDGQICTTFLEYDDNIENIYTTKKLKEYSRMAVLSSRKFTIFDIWEELSTGVEYLKRFECHFATNLEVNKYGKIMCLDFENENKCFATATNIGWVVIWSLTTFEIKNCFEVINPLTQKHENIVHIRDLLDERYIVTYSNYSECILVSDILECESKTELIQYNTKFPTPHTVFLFRRPGLIDMKFEHKLVCCFRDGSVCTFDLATNQILSDSRSLYNSLVNNQPQSANMSIDDYCTQVCYLGPNQKELKFQMLDWKIKIRKVEKIVLPISQLFQKKTQSCNKLDENCTEGTCESTNRERKICSKTCNIF